MGFFLLSSIGLFLSWFNSNVLGEESYVCVSRSLYWFLSLQWTVGGSKNKKKGKAGKAEKKGAMKKQMNKAASSGSSDKDSSAESSAPEEGKITLVHLFSVISSQLTCCVP